MRIDGHTVIIPHIGFPTHAFKAPLIYNPYFAAQGINALVVPMSCQAEHYAPLLRSLFALGNIAGALITMPHKVSTVALVDELMPAAAIAGACNAVRRTADGRLQGDMFDGEGFVRGVLRKGLDLTGKRALVVGAGAYIFAGVRGRIEPHVLIEALETGAKYALAVGAAAATVGIVIGVVTLTGVGFKISYIITQAAQTISAFMSGWIPAEWASLNTLTLLAALIMTGLVCVLMGCGVPTTATYIIMVTVAAPTLVGLGVEPLVAHFFVFYYGVLADITPPVALAAYAAAGMAGSDPFKTGNTAFRLGLAKALVPFVFVFSPSLLLVAKGFTWESFIITFTGCVMGITLMAAALSKFFLVEMKRWEQLSCLFAALLMIAPSLTATLVGVVLVIPMMVNQFRRSKEI